MRKRSLIPNSSPFSRSTRLPFTYRFAARVPCDSKGSECQCGIHTAEAASALRRHGSEEGEWERGRNLFRNPGNLLRLDAPRQPNSAASPPLSENLPPGLRGKHSPRGPCKPPRRFGNQKIGQQLGAQPTPRFRVMSEAMSEAMSDVEIEAVNRPIAALPFLPPV